MVLLLLWLGEKQGEEEKMGTDEWAKKKQPLLFGKEKGVFFLLFEILCRAEKSDFVILN